MLEGFLARIKGMKGGSGSPNVIVVPNQQPQQQLAAQAVQPAAQPQQQGAPGFTSLGAGGVNIATSTPLSLSNPIELDTTSYRKDTTSFLGGGGLLGGLFGRRLTQAQQADAA